MRDNGKVVLDMGKAVHGKQRNDQWQLGRLEDGAGPQRDLAFEVVAMEGGPAHGTRGYRHRRASAPSPAIRTTPRLATTAFLPRFNSPAARSSCPAPNVPIPGTVSL